MRAVDGGAAADQNVQGPEHLPIECNRDLQRKPSDIRMYEVGFSHALRRRSYVVQRYIDECTYETLPLKGGSYVQRTLDGELGRLVVVSAEDADREPREVRSILDQQHGAGTGLRRVRREHVVDLEVPIGREQYAS